VQRRDPSSRERRSFFFSPSGSRTEDQIFFFSPRFGETGTAAQYRLLHAVEASSPPLFFLSSRPPRRNASAVPFFSSPLLSAREPEKDFASSVGPLPFSFELLQRRIEITARPFLSSLFLSPCRSVGKYRRTATTADLPPPPRSTAGIRTFFSSFPFFRSEIWATARVCRGD